MDDLLRDRIYDQLRREILSGSYKPGEQLSVKGLAEKYQVSASPVREALTALQREGLADIIPRVGCFVSQVTLKDVRDIFELRLVLEAASAEMAAARITEEQLCELEGLQSTYAPGDMESYLKYLVDNREFHHAVARATGNAYMADIIGDLLDRMQRMLYVGIGSPTYHGEILDAHPRLIEALRKRDPHEAGRVMVEGIEATRTAVLEQLLASADLPLRR